MKSTAVDLAPAAMAALHNVTCTDQWSIQRGHKPNVIQRERKTPPGGAVALA
jgi:hypothetical protein